MNNCKRCGKCCRLPSGADCKYLIRFNNSLTSCRVWGKNWGLDIGEGQICAPRRFAKIKIKGCSVLD